jgi:chromosomal replication initiation ATPase DnaA
MTKKDLFYYVQLYTGCDDYALKRVYHVIKKYLDANQITKTQVVKQFVDRIIIKDKYDDELILAPIGEFQKEFCLKNNIDLKDLKSKKRNRNNVRMRRDYSMSAHLKGYTFVEIGKSIDRDHTTIIHYVYHYKI